MDFLEKNWKAVFLLVLAASAFISLYNLGRSDLVGDESWLAAVAAQNMGSPDPFHFYLNNQPWYEKPPPAVWLYQASFSVFGVNPFAARLPSALSGIALLCIIFLFARKYFGMRAAFFSWAVTASTLLFAGGPGAIYWAHGIRSGSTDIPMMLFGTASLFVLFIALESIRANPQQPRAKPAEQPKHFADGTPLIIASSILLALCFYMRGLALAPFAAAGLLYFGYLAWHDRKMIQECLRLCAIWLGIAALLALPYVASNLLGDQKNFLDGIFGRFSDVVAKVPQKTERLVAASLLTLVPWLIIYPFAVRWSMKNAGNVSPRGRALAMLLAASLAGAAFYLSILAFPWYLFPIILPASMLCGAWLSPVFRQASGVPKTTALMLFLMVALAFAALEVFPAHEVVRGERVVAEKLSAASGAGTAKTLFIDRSMRKTYPDLDADLLEGGYYYLNMLPPGFNYSILAPGELCARASAHMPGFYWAANYTQGCIEGSGAVFQGAIPDTVLLEQGTTLHYIGSR